jgi:23S rRNA (uracil1939-C5)-methyltransferase
MVARRARPTLRRMPPLTRGQELELTIDSLAYGGRGVARHGDIVVFVARALPGDRVRARVTKWKRRYAEASTVEMLHSGPGRVQARCPHFGTCGGCSWQDLGYERQLAHKQEQVVDALKRLGGLEGYRLEPIEGARDVYGYRNKLEFSWSSGPAGPSLGFHVAGRWDRLLPIDWCHIASPRANELRQAFEVWARGAGLTAHDGRSGEGYLRHLVVREGRRTGDLLAVLVTVPGDVPEPERLIDGLPDGVTGVLHAVNDGVAEITAGLETTVLHGRDGFRERILGLELELSAGAFMQTNTEMCDVLYGHALEYAELRSDDVAWDLYCGAGAIGLLAARSVRSLVGIEIAEESVRSARANAARNGITNAEFIAGDVSRELKRLLELAERPTVAFVDPPRSGLAPKAVRRLIELAPQRIVYVSCNPTTLAPNGRQLVDAGYLLERVRPVDMFPHTHHIEAVASFSRE